MQFSIGQGVALVLAGLAATSTEAANSAIDQQMLLQAYEKLLQRVEQLEASNKKLEAALERNTNTPGVENQTTEISGRDEDLENQILALKKPNESGIAFGASMTMVALDAASGTTTGKNESQLNYLADMEFEIPGDALGQSAGFGDSTFFAHLRAGQGNSLDSLAPTLTGTLNSSSFELSHGDESSLILAEAWYRLGIPLGAHGSGQIGRVEATIGKMDVFGFYDGNAIADDETEFFLNNVFVHNPLLDSGGDLTADDFGFAPGLNVAYVNDINSTTHWKLSLGVFGSGSGASFDDSFSDPFVIGQAEYSGKVLLGLPGNYRFYGWHNGQAVAYADEFDNVTESHAGIGFSIDQQVTKHVTMFSRYGYSLEGQVKFDWAFTDGGQLGGTPWGRPTDRVGVAFGWLNPSSEFKAAAPNLDADADGSPDFGFTISGAENQAELFYAWQINNYFQLTPSVQWVGQPGGDSSADDIVVLGLRAKAAF
jgi:high affinity Mn2+ porin